MRQLIAGNWKMNGTSASLGEIDGICERLSSHPPSCDMLVCPPATLIAQAVWKASGRVAIGGQDCHAEAAGAFTGDISAEMLKDAGASAVIVGHSERRQYHGETSEMVAAKAKAAWRAGLMAIICLGETEDERNAGHHMGVCKDQLAVSVPEGATAENMAIAYEPVWAIGTGRTPSNDEIGQMHAHLRQCLSSRFHAKGAATRILYGGSVKPSNAREILAIAEVGGALVGGASLKAADFIAIFSAAGESA
jgi:triosephosphate isomerase